MFHTAATLLLSNVFLDGKVVKKETVKADFNRRNGTTGLSVLQRWEVWPLGQFCLPHSAQSHYTSISISLYFTIVDVPESRSA